MGPTVGSGEGSSRAIDLGVVVGRAGEKRAEGRLAGGLGGPHHEWRPTLTGSRQVPLPWFLSDLQGLF